MLLREIRSIYHAELEPLYPKDEITSIFNRVIEHHLGMQGFILTFQPEHAVSKEEEQPLFEALAKLKEEIPVQYVLGRTFFMDLPLLVNPSVLIPRPETEELVAWVLSDLPASSKGISVLDIGTGSGNIAIALKKKIPGLTMYGLDYKLEALKLAESNAQLNDVQIHWIHHDIRNKIHLDQKLDIVVSNPPYVMESEKESMSNHVKLKEPSDALFVDDSAPLLYYRAVLETCKKLLKPGGLVYFEINASKGAEMDSLLREYGYSEIQLKKDIFGKNRMIRAKAAKP